MADDKAKEIAPDFTLADTHGQPVRLSQYTGHKHVVLVFNRGLT
jgi:peroxiredoxin